MCVTVLYTGKPLGLLYRARLEGERRSSADMAGPLAVEATGFPPSLNQPLKVHPVVGRRSFMKGPAKKSFSRSNDGCQARYKLGCLNDASFHCATSAMTFCMAVICAGWAEQCSCH